jgi:hypothetical protein
MLSKMSSKTGSLTSIAHCHVLLANASDSVLFVPTNHDWGSRPLGRQQRRPQLESLAPQHFVACQWAFLRKNGRRICRVRGNHVRFADFPPDIIPIFTMRRLVLAHPKWNLKQCWNEGPIIRDKLLRDPCNPTGEHHPPLALSFPRSA